jgi:cytochrome P450
VIARRHVEAALESGESDLVAEIAARLPTDVISELVGVPEADRAEVRRPADTAMHREPGTREIGPEGIAALAGAGRALRGDRRGPPPPAPGRPGLIPARHRRPDPVAAPH